MFQIFGNLDIYIYGPTYSNLIRYSFVQRLFVKFTSSIGLSKQYRPILGWEAKSYFGVTEKKIPMTASPSGC